MSTHISLTLVYLLLVFQKQKADGFGPDVDFGWHLFGRKINIKNPFNRQRNQDDALVLPPFKCLSSLEMSICCHDKTGLAIRFDFHTSKCKSQFPSVNGCHYSCLKKTLTFKVKSLISQTACPTMVRHNCKRAKLTSQYQKISLLEQRLSVTMDENHPKCLVFFRVMDFQ